MRPVTAPCDHDPPLRFSVGTRSLRLDPPDKASDRPLMRPVTVALSSRPDPVSAAVGRGIVTDCPSLFKGGRSAARRVVSVGMLVHPRKRTKHGRQVPWPQRPERAPLQGAKVTNRISGESEPLMRRASESLSVTHVPDQQRRTRCEAWCEERALAAAGAGTE